MAPSRSAAVSGCSASGQASERRRRARGRHLSFTHEPRFQGAADIPRQLGVDRALGSAAFLHLAATYRRTENLPRLDDINLQREPSATTSTADPFSASWRSWAVDRCYARTNRVFEQYDAVTAFTSDGTSRYGGFIRPRRAADGGHRLRPLHVLADDRRLARRWSGRARLRHRSAGGGRGRERRARGGRLGRRTFDLRRAVQLRGGRRRTATAGVVSLRLSGIHTCRSGRSSRPDSPPASTSTPTARGSTIRPTSTHPSAASIRCCRTGAACARRSDASPSAMPAAARPAPHSTCA